MPDIENRNPLNTLLAIAAIVLVGVGAGWFLLGATTLDGADPRVNGSAIEAGGHTAIESEFDLSALTVKTNMRKARLATRAGMLAEPPQRNALHYYDIVLKSDPDHAEANQGLEVILSRLSDDIYSEIADQEFERAYRVARLVSRVRPDHEIIRDVRQALLDHQTALIEAAYQYTNDGADTQAGRVLSDLEGLPGFGAAKLAEVRRSLVILQEARRESEAEKTAARLLNTEPVVPQWLADGRAAMSAGRLIEPADSSALFHLVEADGPDSDVSEFRALLIATLAEKAEAGIADGDLETAEKLLNAALGLDVESTNLTALRQLLETAFVERESSRLVSTRDLKRVRISPAEYPRNAERRGTTGWTDVVFTLTETGETSNITVVNSQPEGVFDRSAIDAVSQWLFEPEKYRGVAITRRVGARLVFEIN